MNCAEIRQCDARNRPWRYVSHRINHQSIAPRPYALTCLSTILRCLSFSDRSRDFNDVHLLQHIHLAHADCDAPVHV